MNCSRIELTSTIQQMYDEGLMPIHVAAALGYVDIAAYFVAKGQSVDVRDANGRTPLMIGNYKQMNTFI